MRQLNTREKFLLGFLAVAGIAAWWGMRGGGMGFDDRADGRGALPALPGDPPNVRVDLLASHLVGYDPNGRNLFAYYTPPPPPRAKPKPRAPAKPPPRPPAKQEKPQQRAVKREPQPPSPDFDYVGYIGPKDDKIAFFMVDDDQMLPARVGEIVEEHFELREFRYGMVVLGFTDERFKDKTTELKLNATE